jgi:hypothetical protein
LALVGSFSFLLGGHYHVRDERRPGPSFRQALANHEKGSPLLPFAQPYVFLVFMVAFWMLVSYVIGAISGWNALSKRFACPKGAFHGETWSFRRARMRFLTRYGNCLTFGADESGLYMSILPFFRVGHPPLLIPWAEVAVAPGDTGLLFKQRTLRLGRQEAIPLRISASLAASLQQAAGAGWSAASVA